MSLASQDLAEARAAREERERKLRSALTAHDLSADLDQVEYDLMYARVVTADGKPVTGFTEGMQDGTKVIILTTED